MTSEKREWVPATRADLLPGAVFVVMDRDPENPAGEHRFAVGERVRFNGCISLRFGEGSAVFTRVGEGAVSQWLLLSEIALDAPGAVAQPEPLTSHAVAAAEIARLRAEVAALREALQWITDSAEHYTSGDGHAECAAVARAALAAQEQAP